MVFKEPAPPTAKELIEKSVSHLGGKLGTK